MPTLCRSIYVVNLFIKRFYQLSVKEVVRKYMIRYEMSDCFQHLKRTGWVKCGVLEPETVASHMYRMAVMGMMIPETLTVNKYK